MLITLAAGLHTLQCGCATGDAVPQLACQSLLTGG
jgi:hypothetical protein